ncbi:hypothetical protein ACFFV7_51110 [Nonomuraea spiralis]|uniref:Uncharacterized protein n=1 Tax=Nonomuraea spiralis TaxID=46182 RepID=A0ABV5IYG2_9ACTN|nr:hypothetical protein [Nonomuraea spiralis]GGS88273.1 hypothetical protein GCM10010176_035040 [Nonomuraea spiralis]
MTTTETEPGRVRPFADVLRDIQGGEVADEAAMLMQQLVAAVQTHGKKGSMTLAIEVQPMKGNTSALMVSAQASIKPPKGEPTAAVFFFDGDNNLVRDDPRQLALPGVLREVGRAVNHDNIKEL